MGGLFTLILVLLSFSPSQAAVSGTGNCAAPANPLSNPLVADYTCTGNLSINGGTVLVLQGDITLTVNGTLALTGSGSEIEV
ncbi:MAG TPA: hypothetical protein VLB09_07885, partial [Nitrospiria bacterium]|nr:hypothetical protein [Nitrospiria bacterium]